jgi:hypothetical protein
MSLDLVWLLLYAHRHRSILGAAGHIMLTPDLVNSEEFAVVAGSDNFEADRRCIFLNAIVC